jgi:hypothetical protein
MKIPVGALRPSQLLWTYGPGALVDLPNLSVITMGLDRWDTNRCPPIEEARLLDQVRLVLGPQVERLRMPPVIASENVDPFSPEAKIGVPVRPFPRWLRCVRCGLLASYDSNLFAIKENPYRPDQTHFIHASCEKGSKSDAVPARFLVACRLGHLDDFPWHWYVHSGPTVCKGTLRFFEVGASLQTENLWVKCDACGTARSLINAFGKDAKDHLPACRGRHPHLDHYEPGCAEDARTVLLGSTNSWFSITISVLAIPTAGDSLTQLVADGWTYFEEVEDVADAKATLKAVTKGNLVQGIERYTAAELWEAIEKHRSGGSTVIQGGDVKRPEWEVLTHPNPPTDWPHFLSERVATPKEYAHLIHEVLLLKRLREVNALVGFTRVDAPDQSADQSEHQAMADMCMGKPEWVPASEVHGEGIFIRFKEDVLHQWESTNGSVLAREQKLLAGHRGWRNARRLDPRKGFPGIRYTMLHTLAHLLIREFALECGYNAASIRERLYAEAGAAPMAGILLYTASADSDGTLGGLIELGKPENLGRLIRQALLRASVCSSDPLCSEHDPEKDRSLHAASCHACGFVSETSCERGNRYLDRALLIRTFDSTGAAFFDDQNGPDDG